MLSKVVAIKLFLKRLSTFNEGKSVNQAFLPLKEARWIL